MADNYLLLVEADDDQHVVGNLLQQHQVSCLVDRGQLGRVQTDTIVIRKQGGVDNLLASLPSVLKGQSDLERLGVIVDADTDIEHRWNRLRQILIKAGGQNVPLKPEPSGTIIIVDQEYRTLTVGVWLMPNNTLPGMLEHFVKFLIPPDDTLIDRARQCLESIPLHERRFPPAHYPKAEIHTWLAWQEVPGKPLGQAITKRYLDTTASQAQQFLDWVRRLFAKEA
jgi:hypothetical protein